MKNQSIQILTKALCEYCSDIFCECHSNPVSLHSCVATDQYDDFIYEEDEDLRVLYYFNDSHEDYNSWKFWRQAELETTWPKIGDLV